MGLLGFVRDGLSRLERRLARLHETSSLIDVWHEAPYHTELVEFFRRQGVLHPPLIEIDPAAVRCSSSVPDDRIRLGGRRLSRLPHEQRIALAGHEFGHLALGHTVSTPSAENGADAFSAQMMGSRRPLIDLLIATRSEQAFYDRKELDDCLPGERAAIVERQEIRAKLARFTHGTFEDRIAFLEKVDLDRTQVDRLIAERNARQGMGGPSH